MTRCWVSGHAQSFAEAFEVHVGPYSAVPTAERRKLLQQALLVVNIREQLQKSSSNVPSRTTMTKRASPVGKVSWFLYALAIDVVKC